MKSLIEKRHILRQNMMAVMGFILCFYFCYHLVSGPRGYLRLLSLDNQITQQSTVLSGVTAERESVETKVTMMRPGSVNRDLLEERVRYVLGYRQAGEVFLLQSSQ